MGKALMAVGLSIAGIGVLMVLGLPLGRLPGDLVSGGGAQRSAFRSQPASF